MKFSEVAQRLTGISAESQESLPTQFPICVICPRPSLYNLAAR